MPSVATPSTMSALVVPLAALRREDRDRSGGKAAALGALLAAGLPVPDGFCVTADAYRAAVAAAGVGEPLAAAAPELPPALARAIDDA